MEALNPDSPEYQPISPELRAILTRQMQEQIQVGIYDSYRKELEHRADMVEAAMPAMTYSEAERRAEAAKIAATRASANTELPLGLRIVNATSLNLYRLDPDTLEIESSGDTVMVAFNFIGSWMDGSTLMFSQEQRDLLIRHAGELQYHSDYPLDAFDI